MVDIQLITMEFTMITAFSAAGAALLSYRSIKANINTTKSLVLLNCLKEYIEVRKDRTKALKDNNKQLCFDYYRELFDLHWTEFRLWMIGYIDNETMKSWLNGRYRNYSNDNLAIMNGKEEIKITYKEVWEKLKQDNYFEKEDPFIRFMNHAHVDEITEAMNMKKELLKNETLSGRITLLLSGKGV